MTPQQIAELVYLVHRYGDDDILRTVAEDRDLYVSQGPNLLSSEQYNTCVFEKYFSVKQRIGIYLALCGQV